MQTVTVEETTLAALAAGLRRNLPRVHGDQFKLEEEPDRLVIQMTAAQICEFDLEEDHCVWQSPRARLMVSLHGFVLAAKLRRNQWRLSVRKAPPHSPEPGSRRKSGGIQTIFVERARRAVTDLERLPVSILKEAVTASTDLEVVLKALQSPEAIAGSALGNDPWQQARLRGLRASRELLASAGGGLTSKQVAELLGITRQAVDKKRKEGKLLALRLGSRGYAYPASQLTKQGVLPGWTEVLAILRHHDPRQEDPWRGLIFLMSPNSYLGGESPLQRLLAGDTAAVLRAAGSFGEHGAA